MQPTNTVIFDKLIRHQVYLLRLISKQSNDFISVLNKNNPKLSAYLTEYIPELNLTNTKISSVHWKKFEAGLKKVRNLAFDPIATEYSEDAIKIIDNEIKYMRSLYNNSIGIKGFSMAIPNINEVNLLNYGSIDGKTIATYFDELKYGDVERIIQNIRTGLVEQKAPYKIVNEIIGSKNIQYKNGVTNITRNNAKAIVRTVTQGIVNNARTEFSKANSDIIKKERYTAVLDGRTTTICLSLDGELFLIAEGPQPPLHRNCRSVRIPVVDGISLVGNRPTITDTRTRRVRDIDFRKDAKLKANALKDPKKQWSSLSVKDRNSLIKKERVAWSKANVGNTPVKTTGEQWLKTQDNSFQNEVLGKKQAELFRSGELKLSKFVDVSGKQLNVSELYGLYKDEFIRAGISP